MPPIKITDPIRRTSNHGTALPKLHAKVKKTKKTRVRNKEERKRMREKERERETERERGGAAWGS